eukprot:TRINITY_DN19792_c0_g1_i1.p1 TRINITY_DN19792_c0_g1~~TRINITY_DN19792_c0_g1_i1.p1  ORF type:complete len:554 (-),score=94.29 TRINITY_DN19792_c0_g1_i1:278-1939(-)
MESSSSSLTFKGSISEAIIESQRQRKLFVVYISGEDENSSLLEQSTWMDLNVVESISRRCIFLHLVQGSIDASHFSAIYPPKSCPSISAIGYNGVLLWQNEGYISAKDFVAAIERSCMSLQLQETAATVLTAALTSKKPENLSSSAPSVALLQRGSSSNTDVPSSSTDKTSQESESRPLSSSELIGESRGCEPIADQKVTELNEETLRAVHADDLKHKDYEQSISMSETAEIIHSPLVADVDSSEVESKFFSVRDDSTTPPESISLDDHQPIRPLKSADTAHMEWDSAHSQGHSQIASSSNEEGDNVQDQKADRLTNVIKSNDVYLNIRMPDGSSLQVKFSVTDTLRLVKNYVNEKQIGGIGSYDLAIPYPRKVFDEQDMGKALSELGLVNREALIVVPHHPATGFQRGASLSREPTQNTMSGTNSSSNNNEGHLGYLKRMLSYLNPFSYFGGNASSSSLESSSNNGLWQYRPNPALPNYISGGERPYQTYSPNLGSTSTGENVSKSRKLSSSHFGSNIHTLKHDEDDVPFKDRNAFWNGNSTQYGGDDGKQE